MAPAQMRMAEALTAPPKSTDLKDQFTRRDQAIAAIVGYCDVNEPLLTKVLQAREPGPPPEFAEHSAGDVGLVGTGGGCSGCADCGRPAPSLGHG